MSSVIRSVLQDIPLPRMVKIRQRFSNEEISDVEETISKEIGKPEIEETIEAGMRIAIGVGSRGMAKIPEIVRAVVTELKRRGAEPFVVPAMGSHGGATDEGQREALKNLGVTEESAHCPIRSSMAVVELGTMKNGLPILMDKNAFEADGIIVINRIKAHNGFSGFNESGLVKMITIGLGKQKGADACHKLGFGTMAENIIEMAKVKLAQAPFLFGIGTVENAYDRVRTIVAIPAAKIIEDERPLLLEAKTTMPKLLLKPMDVLIVDQIGKEFSGGGMDPYTTGRAATPYIAVGPEPTRLAVLDVTEKSHGNAGGMGVADFTTKRLFEKIDFEATYINNLTSTATLSGKVPIVLESDCLAMQAAVKTCNVYDMRQVRMVRIANSLHIEHILISESMLEEARQHPEITVISEPQEICFDAEGNLLDLGQV